MKKVNKFCLTMNGLRDAAVATRSIKNEYSNLVQVDYNVWTGDIRCTYISRSGKTKEAAWTWRMIALYNEPKTMQQIAVDIYRKVVGK